ncbi:hypothetical protein G6011_04892 [Alternaria panax]|uniref:BTB domain-containing protein n=1 Tax=Alternaria panax TaxID=48097 RepID=A0AAD4NUB2_9PLEO|nr:hypothetical protein G6011_04892 [Alternaria panax]
MASPSRPKSISLFNDPTLSDVKIRQVYKGKTNEYFVHKSHLMCALQLVPQSIYGQFQGTEASKSTIKVLDDDSQNFEYMLKFLYTMESVSLPLEKSDNAKGKIARDILIPIGIYILADKYKIAPLV